MKKTFEEFAYRYNINVLDSTRRAYTPTTHNYSYDNDSYQTDFLPYRTETLLTILIPESKLDSLRHIEEMFYNQNSGRSNRISFEQMIVKQLDEQQVRERSPAVAEAYEKYQMLLTLNS